MRDENNRFYGFGEFRVDARRRILLKNGETIPLTPRNFDLLLVMIENEGEILTHDDLLNKVWEGTFVEQANLKNAVSVLRKILGEGPGEGFYIRTIPRRGYSFVAPVHVIADQTDSDTIVHKETEHKVFFNESRGVSEEQPSLTAANVRHDTRHVIQVARLVSQSRYKVILACLIILFLVAGIFGLRSYFTAPRPIVYDATNVIISKITSDGNLIGGDASISPNGKYLVYVVRDGENVSVWTRQIVTGISRQISSVMQGSVWACALTPDEDFIFYIFNSNTDRSKSGLFKISTFGGSSQKIADNTGGSLSIAPDGKRLAVIHVAGEQEIRIETMNPDGGDLRVAWTDKGDLRIWSIKYSPDGKTLLFSIRKQLSDKTVYYIGEVPVDGGVEKIIMPEQERQIADAVWLPDKKSLLLSVRELNAELRQIWQYFPANAEWKRVTNDNASYRGISLTDDGKTLVASQDSRLTSLWMSPTGTAADLKQVMSGTHYLIDVGWLNNSNIVYSIVENSKEMIGSMTADGSGNRLLTAGDDGIWVFPAPSRDGKHIAFASQRSGRRQIWEIDADGRNPVQLSQFDTDVYDGRLLADGKTSVFLQLATPQKATLILHKKDGQSRELIQNQTKRWAVSPDERSIAVEIIDPQSQKRVAAVLDIESGQIVKKFDFVSNRALRWTSDGKGLGYDVNEGGVGKIVIQPLDGGPSITFLTLKSEEIFSFDWTADGKSFAMIRGNHLTDAVKISVGSGH